MPADLAGLRDDLSAEQAALEAVVVSLPAAAWETPTPAEPWAVRDQIAHLTYFDERARVALTEPDRFLAELARDLQELDRLLDGHLDGGRARSPEQLLAAWREERDALLAALAATDPATRVPWYGPPMSVASFTTARLMECWAHGQDVIDALGVDRQPTRRLRHIAHLGAGTRGFSYSLRGLPVPEGGVHVALTAPGGGTWAWGDPTLPDRVEGDAVDFCLVVTQRRHPADTRLVAEGPLAVEWLGIAQAFAGPPGPGRAAGQFPRRTAGVEAG
jgi:uncharacterized protein (TIGR03084 family)